MWREIQGCNDWQGLVGPAASWLHPLLRGEIIRYGELLAACYKAFDVDPSSSRHLHCKFARDDMLRNLGLHHSGYRVTKYIYASPREGAAAPRSRWIGYVAVSALSDDDAETKTRLGREDIVVAFRGTVTSPEWAANFMSSLTPAGFHPLDPRPGVQVEAGFLSLYTSQESGCRFGLRSCREQLLSEVSRLLRKNKKQNKREIDVSITLVGHSMGSSLALLLAYDICELGINSLAASTVAPVTVFSFGGPRVGNSGFKRRCEELGVKVLRVVNVNDPVTKLPGVFLNEATARVLMPWSCSCYVHVGVEVALEFFSIQNPGWVHDLDGYIVGLRCPNVGEINENDDGKEVTVLSGMNATKPYNFALNLSDDDQLLMDDDWNYMVDGFADFLAMHVTMVSKSALFLVLLFFYLSKTSWFE
ncbi:unnamed protein product [Linum tenue]|uniref:Fungal lipase-type domain-containing protein n=1 Tax=Linum tenue TaxID=586396 RepID=A0AAV0IDL3_9ROSI|nr:unnamed protein product [Linum tenue]